MSLSGAAAGAQEGLDQYLTRKLAAQMQAQHIAEQQAAAQRAAQQDTENAAYRKATLGLQQQQFEAGRSDKAAAATKATQDAAATDAFIASLPANVRPLVQLHQRGVTGVTQHDLETPEAHQAHVTADQQRADDHTIALRKREKQVDAQFREPRAGADPETVALRNDLLRIQVDAAKDKATAVTASKDKATSDAQAVTEGAITQLQRLKTHPGLNAAQGAYEMRGFTQDAQNFNAIRDQVVNALALPNLGALKGPMSDKDVAFVKNISTRLGNHNIDEAEAVKAIDEAIVFLQGKLSEGGTTNTASNGAGAGAPKAGGFRVVGVR